MTVTNPNKQTSKPGIEKARNALSSPGSTTQVQTVTKVPFSTSKSALTLKFDQVVKLGAESMSRGLCPPETYLG